jgi:hypothetical protein
MVKVLEATEESLSEAEREAYFRPDGMVRVRGGEGRDQLEEGRAVQGECGKHTGWTISWRAAVTCHEDADVSDLMSPAHLPARPPPLTAPP